MSIVIINNKFPKQKINYQNCITISYLIMNYNKPSVNTKTYTSTFCYFINTKINTNIIQTNIKAVRGQGPYCIMTN